MDTKYQKLTITLPSDLLKQFKEFCISNGINLSSRIAVLIKNDLKEKILFQK